jgi:hypothetical protein
MTKNITLAVEEEVLDRVRVVAAERKTTVNGLVRAYLEQVAVAEDKKGRFQRRIKGLRARTKFEVGPVTWTRGELHER